MKRVLVFLIIALFAFSVYFTRPALAQAETPPTGLVGEVRGTVTNRNTGKLVSESLEIMLHVLDQDLTDLDMKHAQSQSDGTFVFADVPFDANLQFSVMAIYDGATYSSNPSPADMNSMQVAVDVPVYDSTTDLTDVRIDQMHVLFDFAEDGLETKEIYVISSTSERTVKDVFPLEDDKSATLKFPLPADADYVFFKPDDPDRFLKFRGWFADTYPILPTTQTTQYMVNYLVPFAGEREYTYTAPLNIAQINFLVPEQANVSVRGSGLLGPEAITLQTGESYKVYSYTALAAGQTVSLSIGGKVPSESRNTKSNMPLVLGIAFLGLAIMGVGIRWWRRPENSQPDANQVISNQITLDELILKMAKLDDDLANARLSPESHQQLRQDLMRKAKRLL